MKSVVISTSGASLFPLPMMMFDDEFNEALKIKEERNGVFVKGEVTGRKAHVEYTVALPVRILATVLLHTGKPRGRAAQFASRGGQTHNASFLQILTNIVRVPRHCIGCKQLGGFIEAVCHNVRFESDLHDAQATQLVLDASAMHRRYVVLRSRVKTRKVD